MHSLDIGTSKSALDPNAEKKAILKGVFCGKEIDLDLDSDVCERMAPEIVKQKWRREQIMAQRDFNEQPAFQKWTFLFQWKSKQNRIDDLPCYVDERSVPAEMCFGGPRCKTPSISDCQQAPICSVWCGWLHVRLEGLLKPSQRWWTVLNVDREQLMLECYLEDAATCAMFLARSLALDPAKPARRESAMLTCGGRARVSIAERGSGRRYSAACDSPEEADRLEFFILNSGSPCFESAFSMCVGAHSITCRVAHSREGALSACLP